MRLTLLIALLAGAAQGAAQTPEQAFAGANRLYQQGKLMEAKAAYESILNAGFESGALYYNLGNACYKSGNIAGAILNYERARRLMPGDEDLLHNLQLATLMMADKIEPAPRLFIWDYWEEMKNALSPGGLTWLVYLLYVTVAGSVCFMMLAGTYRARRAGLLAGLCGGILLVAALCVAAGKLSDLARGDLAVVTADVTTLKNSPDTQSSDAFVLHGGAKVQIIDRVNEWIKIRLADGKIGWMEKAAATAI